MVTYPGTSLDRGFRFLFGYFTAPSVSRAPLYGHGQVFLCVGGKLLHFLQILPTYYLLERLIDTC